MNGGHTAGVVLSYAVCMCACMVGRLTVEVWDRGWLDVVCVLATVLLDCGLRGFSQSILPVRLVTVVRTESKGCVCV